MCEAGWYLSGGLCRECPLGTYSPLEGRAKACTQCPWDERGHAATTEDTGATQLEDCVFVSSCMHGYGISCIVTNITVPLIIIIVIVVCIIKRKKGKVGQQN